MLKPDEDHKCLTIAVMENREDVWRSMLQEQFEHFEADTEKDLWPAIEEKIDAKRVPFYLWRSTWLVAASVAVLMGLIWMLGQPTTPAGQAPMAEGPKEQISPVQERPEGITPESPAVQLAEIDMPTGPSPEVLQQLQQQRNNDISSVETGDRNDQLTPSTLPPSRVIPRVGPMQSMMPERLQNLDAARPRENQNLAVARPRITPQARPAPAPAQQITQGERQSLDLNNLTLGDAVSFASNELGKLVETPLEVYTEEVEGQEVRTYQLDLFNFRITRKTHKKSKS